MMEDVEKWLENRIILKVYRGSIAYGTNDANSDVDIGGVCIPPKPYLYGLYPFEHYESKNYRNHPGHKETGLAADTMFYGLHKFVKLAVSCNPNILETLYTDRAHILYCNSLGRMLTDNRHLFPTRQARYTFGGYALSQFRKLTSKLPLEETRNRIAKLAEAERNLRTHAVRVEHEIAQHFQKSQLASDDVQDILHLRGELTSLNQRLATMVENRTRIERIMGGGTHGSHAGLIEKYGYDVKHAMHLVRLLHMGLEILTEGECRVLRPDKDYLLAIRYGEFSLDQIRQEAEKLFRLLDEAYISSKLPDSPDIEKINQLLIDITEASFADMPWET